MTFIGIEEKKPKKPPSISKGIKKIFFFSFLFISYRGLSQSDEKKKKECKKKDRPSETGSGSFNLGYPEFFILA